jgi:ATP-dependent exoDNAse (exonuclease V) alpha subunit
MAMTVHGAKNQEFDRVAVLWPHGIKNDALLRRKLLYNALTRAKEEAVVLVQGGDKRAKTDPTLALLQG